MVKRKLFCNIYFDIKYYNYAKSSMKCEIFKKKIKNLLFWLN